MNDRYEIIIAGQLPERWSFWFEDSEIVYNIQKKQTAIYAEVADQAALHGLLNGIRDLGLYLISVQIKSDKAAEKCECI